MQGMSMEGFDLWIERLVVWVQPRHHYEYLAHSKRCEPKGRIQGRERLMMCEEGGGPDCHGWR